MKLTGAWLNFCSKHRQRCGINSPRATDNSKITSRRRTASASLKAESGVRALSTDQGQR